MTNSKRIPYRLVGALLSGFIVFHLLTYWQWEITLSALHAINALLHVFKISTFLIPIEDTHLQYVLFGLDGTEGISFTTAYFQWPYLLSLLTIIAWQPVGFSIKKFLLSLGFIALFLITYILLLLQASDFILSKTFWNAPILFQFITSFALIIIHGYDYLKLTFNFKKMMASVSGLGGMLVIFLLSTRIYSQLDLRVYALSYPDTHADFMLKGWLFALNALNLSQLIFAHFSISLTVMLFTLAGSLLILTSTSSVRGLIPSATLVGCCCFALSVGSYLLSTYSIYPTTLWASLSEFFMLCIHSPLLFFLILLARPWEKINLEQAEKTPELQASSTTN